MLIAVVVIGFAVLAFQLSGLRILILQLVKQLATTNLILEQLEGVDADGIAERVQAEIDIAAGKYG